MSQLPNFLLAAPMIYLSFCALVTWLRNKDRQSPFCNRSLLPYMVLYAFMLFTCVTMMHVQIITRFLTSMVSNFE